jgi:hypothetical protein
MSQTERALLRAAAAEEITGAVVAHPPRRAVHR